MGTRLGPLFHALTNEVIWLHAKWLEFQKLYNTSKERFELMNQTGGFFFGVIQRVLWDDILLHIGRLTDDPGSNGEERLVISRLKGQIQDHALAAQIRPLLKAVNSRAEVVRDERNRRLAHLDL